MKHQERLVQNNDTALCQITSPHPILPAVSKNVQNISCAISLELYIRSNVKYVVLCNFHLVKNKMGHLATLEKGRKGTLLPKNKQVKIMHDYHVCLIIPHTSTRK